MREKINKYERGKAFGKKENNKESESERKKKVNEPEVKKNE